MSHRIRLLAVMCAVLALSLAACQSPTPAAAPTNTPITSATEEVSSPLPPAPTPEPTAEPTMETTAEPTLPPEPTEAGPVVEEGGVVDPCALVTEEQVTAILGGYQMPLYDFNRGMCFYTFDPGEDRNHELWIGVGSGEQGKQILLAEMTRVASGDAAQQAVEMVSGQLETISMADLVRQYAFVLEQTGDLAVTELDSPGEVAYFFWTDSFAGRSLAEFIAVEGDVYVLLFLRTLDEETSRQASIDLGTQTLEMLPDTFTLRD